MEYTGKQYEHPCSSQLHYRKHHTVYCPESGWKSLPDTIAQELHISSHLSRTFKEQPPVLLLSTSIRSAFIRQRSLHNTDLLTYEIAEAVGYKDATYFSSIFRKYEGLSPSEYKTKFFCTIEIQ
ncbi:MAG: AraC family transcriptional regulator [Ruminococcus sp.]